MSEAIYNVSLKIDLVEHLILLRLRRSIMKFIHLKRMLISLVAQHVTGKIVVIYIDAAIHHPF